MIFFSADSLVLSTHGSRRDGLSSFTFTRPEATASASAILTGQAIAGSMHSYTGWRLTSFWVSRRSDQDAGSCDHARRYQEFLFSALCRLIKIGRASCRERV